MGCTEKQTALIFKALNDENRILILKLLKHGEKCACHDQYENVKAAVSNLGLSIPVEYITDMEKVMEYGVMSMPAIVFNEKVVAYGKVLSAADVEKLLKR